MVLRRAAGRPIVIALPNVNRMHPRLVETTIGTEIKFSLRTTDDAVAAVWKAAATAELERIFAGIEAGPVPLKKQDLVALSRHVYDLYWEAFGEDPGEVDQWAAFKAMTRASMEGRILNAAPLVVGSVGDEEEAFGRFGEDLSGGIDALPRTDSTVALESRFGGLASFVLAKEGIDVDDRTRGLLLREIALASLDVGWRLKRAAGSDYSPDPKEARFPVFTKPKAEAVSIRDVFDRWRNETGPASSTVTNWTTVVARLEKELGSKAQNVHHITPEDMIAFKDSLIQQGLSQKTVADSYLASTKALLNFAVGNRIIATNPAAGIKVAVKVRAGEGRQPYDDLEVARLLALSEREKLAHVRWLPLLAATTGARIGELAQLWGDRIFVRDGIHCMQIAPAPDGGSLKNAGSERVIPIHPEVIRRGFLDFAKSRGGGPLFYQRSKLSAKPGSRHASKGPANRVSEWVRASGFKDSRKDPSHAFRHWWKSAAVRVRVPDSVADAIQGHAGKGEASRYRHIDVATMAEYINLMPVPREGTSSS